MRRRAILAQRADDARRRRFPCRMSRTTRRHRRFRGQPADTLLGPSLTAALTSGPFDSSRTEPAGIDARRSPPLRDVELRRTALRCIALRHVTSCHDAPAPAPAPASLRFTHRSLSCDKRTHPALRFEGQCDSGARPTRRAASSPAPATPPASAQQAAFRTIVIRIRSLISRRCATGRPDEPRATRRLDER